jgi:hypothetical protein
VGAITLDPWVLLERGTYIAALMFIIAAFFMEWIFTGKQYRRDIAAKDKEILELKQENRELEHRIWEMVGLVKKATNIAEKNSSIAETAIVNKTNPG